MLVGVMLRYNVVEVTYLYFVFQGKNVKQSWQSNIIEQLMRSVIVFTFCPNRRLSSVPKRYYLKGTYFRGNLFSRRLIFAGTNFRGNLFSREFIYAIHIFDYFCENLFSRISRIFEF